MPGFSPILWSIWHTVEACHWCTLWASYSSSLTFTLRNSYSVASIGRPLVLMRVYQTAPSDWWNGASSCIYWWMSSCSQTRDLWFLLAMTPTNTIDPRWSHQLRSLGDAMTTCPVKLSFWYLLEFASSILYLRHAFAPAASWSGKTKPKRGNFCCKTKKLKHLELTEALWKR